jgi:hypothetical protein
MSKDHSSNPFRRKGASSPGLPTFLEPLPVADHRVYQQHEPAGTQSIELPPKSVKKVRVQSPPPQSPASLDSPSTIVDENDSIYNRAPTPIQRDDDPFESIVSDTSEEEGFRKPSQAPPNPFQKTLETMGYSTQEVTTSRTKVPPTGRASLDVEAFKRLLMTGSAGPGISTLPAASAAHLHHGLGDGGSSTEASSSSRHSIFEPVQEIHQESPGTPHEISESEDDRRGADIPSSFHGRKKPLPPSSRHGKLIRVELREDPSTTATVPIANHRLSLVSRPSATDLNKPLPPAPARASHDSDRESIFDLESAGKVPEPPSPPYSIRRKTPPEPPLTRRHSQRLPDYRTRRADRERLAPSVEEEALNQRSESISSGDPQSSGVRSHPDSGRAPPPPPSRRPASIFGSIHQSPSPNMSSAPITSPTLLPTRASSSQERPSSVVMDATANKRASTLPPPPPPPRQGDSSRRTSGENSRKSGESASKGSERSSIQEEERPDILADLTKLQREIDALRARGDRNVS